MLKEPFPGRGEDYSSPTYKQGLHFLLLFPGPEPLYTPEVLCGCRGLISGLGTEQPEQSAYGAGGGDGSCLRLAAAEAWPPRLLPGQHHLSQAAQASPHDAWQAGLATPPLPSPRPQLEGQRTSGTVKVSG